MYPDHARDNTFKLRLLKQPFLFIRLIFFLLLGFLNVAIVAFSIWSIIIIMRAFASEVFSGSMFTLFNSCFFLPLGTIVFTDTVFPPAAVLNVKSEIAWSGILSVLSLASSILVTLDGLRLFRQPGVNVSVYTPSIFLIPACWCAFTFIISYLTILLVLTTTHIRIYPNIYNVPVVLVPWFQPRPDSTINDDKLSHDSQVKSNTEVVETNVNLLGNVDIEQQYQNTVASPSPVLVSTKTDEATGAAVEQPLARNVTSCTPQWANDVNAKTKRGITQPFRLPTEQVRLSRHVTLPHARLGYAQMGTNQKSMNRRIDPEVPTPPQDVRVSDRVGQRLFELERDRGVPMAVSSIRSASSLTRTSQEEWMGVMPETGERRRSVSSLFPSSVQDEEWDQPLKKPPFNNGLGDGWRTADNMTKGFKGRI